LRAAGFFRKIKWPFGAASGKVRRDDESDEKECAFHTGY
jgi:hypothetical protein